MIYFTEKTFRSGCQEFAVGGEEACSHPPGKSLASRPVEKVLHRSSFWGIGRASRQNRRRRVGNYAQMMICPPEEGGSKRLEGGRGGERYSRREGHTKLTRRKKDQNGDL